MLLQPLQSAAIRVALEAGVLHAIEEQGGKDISAADLAEKTGYDELLIGTIVFWLKRRTDCSSACDATCDVCRCLQ